jgi:protein-L-isoaspartate(D-aspartate) O-methyltransferase
MPLPISTAGLQVESGVLLENSTNNISLLHGDPALGWPEAAPFDAIIINEGNPDDVAPNLQSQLKNGGRIVVPSTSANKVYRLEKRNGQIGNRTELDTHPAGFPSDQNRVELRPAVKINTATQRHGEK